METWLYMSVYFSALLVEIYFHLNQCTNILGTDIEMVISYKYLGVHLNNKLD